MLEITSEFKGSEIFLNINTTVKYHFFRFDRYNDIRRFLPNTQNYFKYVLFSEDNLERRG